jgi:uncharacterized protein (DUF433 family)
MPRQDAFDALRKVYDSVNLEDVRAAWTEAQPKAQ